MDIVRLYTEDRMSIREISEVTGIKAANIRYALNKQGVLRSRADGIRIAAENGRLGAGLRGKKRIFTDEWKANMSSAKKKQWEGKAIGFSKKPNGYLEYTTGKNKGRSVHVVTMEEHIGRRLFANEVVHHIDEDRSNNALSNLRLMTRSEHAAHHARQNISKRRRNKNGQLK